jgi:hypothetical protein
MTATAMFDVETFATRVLNNVDNYVLICEAEDIRREESTNDRENFARMYLADLAGIAPEHMADAIDELKMVVYSAMIGGQKNVAQNYFSTSETLRKGIAANVPCALDWFNRVEKSADVLAKAKRVRSKFWTITEVCKIIRETLAGEKAPEGAKGDADSEGESLTNAADVGATMFANWLAFMEKNGLTGDAVNMMTERVAAARAATDAK